MQPWLPPSSTHLAVVRSLLCNAAKAVPVSLLGGGAAARLLGLSMQHGELLQDLVSFQEAILHMDEQGGQKHKD